MGIIKPTNTGGSGAVDSVNGQTGDVILNIPSTLSELTDDSTHRLVTDTEKYTWSGKQNAITTGTTAQYFKGDLSLGTMNSAAVGLGNVDNTSDANKPISTATQSALNNKYDSSNFIAGTNYIAPLSLKVNPIYTDDFATDFSNYSLSPYSTSTFSISSGVLNTGLSSGTYKTSLVKNNSLRIRNLICKTDLVGVASTPQLHFREVDSNNFIVAYISQSTSTVYNGYVLAGTLVGNSATIPSFSANNNYTLVSKLYEEYFSTDVLYNGNVIMSIENIGLDIALFNSLTNGFGSANTTSFATYSTLGFSKIDEFLNIICLGDSLTYGSGIQNTKDIYPNLLKTNYINYPIGITNKGIAGNKISDVSIRLGTDVIPFNVATAKRNIVLLMIGTNDIASGTAVSTIFSNWEALVNNIKKFGFEVWAITNPPRDDNATYRTNIKALNELIKASTAPSKIIDFYASCVDESDVTKSGYLYSDNLHLTALSDGVIAGLIQNQINNKFNI